MKKYIIIGICILLMIGLFIYLKEDVNNSFEFSKNTFNYYEEVYLEDLIDGSIVIDEKRIDTTIIGEFSVDYTYSIDGVSYDDTFSYKVVDSEKPFAIISENYYVELGEEFNLEEKIIFVDNEDINVSYIIDGEYNINAIGEYLVTVVLEDNYLNKNEYTTTINVLDKVDEYIMPEIDYFDVVDKHKTSSTKIGIDVSAWQGDVDWELVKSSGIEFVILRVGVGHKDGINLLDTKFLDNLAKVKELDIPVGIYYYSYAKNEEEAIDQARWIVDTLDGVELELPITFDWEIWNKFNVYELNTIKLNNIAKAFMDEVESFGYDSMNYGSANRLRDFFKLDNYKTWLAHYTDETYYEGDYYMWQLTDKGIVPGVNGYCDINVLYE